MDGKFAVEKLPLEELVLKPRKMDIEVDNVSLVWLPFRVNGAGVVEQVYELSPTAGESRPGGDGAAVNMS